MLMHSYDFIKFRLSASFFRERNNAVVCPEIGRGCSVFSQFVQPLGRHTRYDDALFLIARLAPF